MPALSRSEHLFVVRLWREAGLSDPPWRGSIEHASSGRRRFFSNMMDLADFVLLRLSEDSTERRSEIDLEVLDALRPQP